MAYTQVVLYRFFWPISHPAAPQSFPLQNTYKAQFKTLRVFAKIQAHYASKIASTTQFPTKFQNKNTFSQSSTFDPCTNI